MTFDLLMIFLLASAAAAATGIIFRPGAWYDALRKPAFTPPKWAFPVAWSAIYLLSAVAAARVATLPGAGMALALWSAQIALNTLWTPVFFGARQIALGMVVILTLLVTVASMIVAFWQLDWRSALLLLPYLAWLVVAAGLNWRIWRDNPGAAGR
ncbi:tryptophan-rich sensory protein [Paracoccus aestuarii]|uniref:Tryptophan-rich sensory protein n=1 Tax=Paracoccus aestuarii TaxID=453842 RepID=A0A419A0U3_9RHOB|nr:TspO/MBR family protein [Paracoccus aestuarii]RJL06543.1 tryptophan-rich sensory protein [Paracoccus aestuarii]WCQ98847.1 tryptophan-rich sensory protein [Paracoccus aestuarii]